MGIEWRDGQTRERLTVANIATCVEGAMYYKHGKSKTLVYRSWVGMMHRCYDKKIKAYRDYGARGISVCKRWHNFLNFFADMGDRECGWSIERLDVNGNYEPSNCIWIPNAEQHKNKRKSARRLRSEWHPRPEWHRRAIAIRKRAEVVS